MSLWQHLFNKRFSKSSATPAPGMKFSIRDDILHIKKINWVAPGAYSPNRRYFIAGKKREIVLVDASQKEIVYYANDFNQIIPFNLHVSNSGAAIIDDNHDQPDALHSVFHIVSPTGERIASHGVGANIHNSAIDEQGRIALFHTTESAQTEYDHVLYIFDVASGQLIQNWRPPTGPPAGYSFTENARITLDYNQQDGQKSFRYTLSGERVE